MTYLKNLILILFAGIVSPEHRGDMRAASEIGAGGIAVTVPPPTNCTADDTVSYTSQGVIGCIDDNAGGGIMRHISKDSAPSANAATASTSFISGMGSRNIVMTAANCAGDTITLTRNGSSANTGTEGVNFVCSGTSADCATSVAAWITFLNGTIASANSPVSGTVYVSKDNSESLLWGSLSISTSDATCAAITQSNDGGMFLYGRFIDLVSTNPGFLGVGIIGDNVGATARITKHLSATASLDFTALAASSCETLVVAVTGAVDGNTVVLGVPNALADVDGATERTTFLGWVSAAGAVSVRRCNNTLVITANPAAATVRADVWQH